MDPVIGGLIGTGIQGGGNIISTLLTNNANKKLTRQSWARDDTAVQRRAADMNAAGINPLLAAGNAAQNTAPIAMKGAEIPDFGGSFISGVQARTQQKIQEMQGKIGENTIKNLQVQNRIMNLDEAQKANDLLLNIKRGTRSNDSGLFNQIVSSIQYAMDAYKKIKEGKIGAAIDEHILDPIKKKVREHADDRIDRQTRREEEKKTPDVYGGSSAK